MSTSDTPRTNACQGWPHPHHVEHIRFEGCDVLAVAPEDYEALFEHARTLERERDSLSRFVDSLWADLCATDREVARLRDLNALKQNLTAMVTDLRKENNTLRELLSISTDLMIKDIAKDVSP